MAVRMRVEPINRDIEIMLSESLSPKAQSAAFAQFAKEKIEEAKEIDRAVLGRVPPYKVFVDGREGAALEQVAPNGVIVAEFEVFIDALGWIGEQLVKHSPVGSGKDPHPGLYQQSHTLFADEYEVPIGDQIPPAREYVFMNMLPYTRKIEQGSSSQAPDGVYQAVAMLARARFGNVAKIYFTYRGVVGGRQVNPEVAGATKSQRNRRGRFVFQGGSRAHNIGGNRFPAITVRPN